MHNSQIPCNAADDDGADGMMMPDRLFRVFVVDDTTTNIEILLETLGDLYDVRVALDGATALDDIPEAEPDLILLDVMMPGMDGYEVCRRLKQDPRTRHVPVIFVTARHQAEDEIRGLELGAVDYITKPFVPVVVQARVRSHLHLAYAKAQLAQHNQRLEETVRQRTEDLRLRNADLEATRLQLIRRLGRAAEYRDNETGLHVIRMSNYARLLALAIGWTEERADVLLHAAPMHDIGKIGIPDRILLKPGALTDEEWPVMRGHPAIGARIIGWHESDLLRSACTVALTHHEKWDGTGYPRALQGTHIPVEGRIVAVCDVFDALTTRRPYKDAWPVADAVAWMLNNAGRHFEPGLVEAFIGILPRILEVREQWQESREELPEIEVR
jgi:putative two-component system response regulator